MIILITPFCNDTNRQFDVDHNQCILKCNSNSKYDFETDQCVARTCFGIVYSDSNVCSGHGVCSESDVCVCNSEYNGIDCNNIGYGYWINS